MRKAFPVDNTTHKDVVDHLNYLELKGHGKPSITSWIKSACLEKIRREKNQFMPSSEEIL